MILNGAYCFFGASRWSEGRVALSAKGLAALPIREAVKFRAPYP